MSEPEQPRRRHSDVVDDRLEKLEKRVDWLTSEQARQGLRLSDVQSMDDRLGKLERDIGDIWLHMSILEGRVDAHTVQHGVRYYAWYRRLWCWLREGQR